MTLSEERRLVTASRTTSAHAPSALPVARRAFFMRIIISCLFGNTSKRPSLPRTMNSSVTGGAVVEGVAPVVEDEGAAAAGGLEVEVDEGSDGAAAAITEVEVDAP